jgi:SPP1 gp7 family putative phage head morphogenesis protein
MAKPPDNLSTKLLDEVNSYLIDLFRFSASMNRDVQNELDDLESELLTMIDRTVRYGKLNPAQLASLLRQSREIIADAYDKIAITTTDNLSNVVLITSTQIANEIEKHIIAPLIQVSLGPQDATDIISNMMIEGSFPYEWWQTQDASLAARFMREMRMGLGQGETVDELSQRVSGTSSADYTDGIMDLSSSQAEALVRTSVVSAANATRLATYADNADVLTAIQWVSVLDNRTTPICMALDGLMWEVPNDSNKFGDYVPIGHNKDFPGPTAHFNCRSTQIPVVRPYAELESDQAQQDYYDNFMAAMEERGLSEEQAQAEFDRVRATMDGEGVTAQTFDQWLSGKSDSFQNDLLGVGIADLWRNGDISLTDLTKQDNRPLTLAELQQKVKG